jgi:voltage-gated potassium channel
MIACFGLVPGGAVDLLGSPFRTLVSIVLFMLVVILLATLAYMGAGWSFSDASYMVLLTIYTVGYGEVHPISTPYLHGVTVALMILGCTGMILLTGALVQFLTITQLQQILGGRRVKAEIDKLENHVIVIGFGRIGVMLAKELKAGGAPFVILEQNETRAAEVRALGHLCLVGDATSETALYDAGIARARTLASVLPNDAANVFITLSARALNPIIEIIARGEVPSTEKKLIQAGANKVVLPTHIGAERIAEMILFPETARMLRTSTKFNELERSLRGLGLDMTVVVVPEKGALTGLSIEQIERRADGGFFIVQLNRQGGDTINSPDRALKVLGGDGVVIVGRHGQAARAMFEAPAEKVRAGRSTF